MNFWNDHVFRMCVSLIFFSIVLMPGLVLAEQASLGPSVADKARQAVRNAQENGGEKRGAFLERIRGQLDELDKQLVNLKDKGTVLREKAKTELILQLNKISQKKNDILPKLQVAKQDSEATWQDVKQGIDKAVQELKIAVDEAALKYF